MHQLTISKNKHTIHAGEETLTHRLWTTIALEEGQHSVGGEANIVSIWSNVSIEKHHGVAISRSVISHAALSIERYVVA